jgi:antitoxin VapB
MPLQIADRAVIDKVELLARRTGLSQTAVLERALDRLINESAQMLSNAEHLTALLAQIDRIPDRADAIDPVQWVAHGLPQ